jgi:hypothetical protein
MAQKCGECNGTGRCKKCGGTGKTTEGEKCLSCSTIGPYGRVVDYSDSNQGTGVCNRCQGKGEIPSEEKRPENDSG